MDMIRDTTPIRPNNFPIDNSPSDTDAFYTQEGGQARKIFLSVLKTYYTAGLVTDTVYSLANISDVSGVGSPAVGDWAKNAAGDSVAVYNGAAWLVLALGGGGAGATVAFDALTSGTVTAAITRLGGSATTIANPSAGEYTLDVASGAHLEAATVFGNNTTLNGSSEFILRIDNSANSRDRRVIIQLYDANNGALVDQQVTATNHTQAVSGNITTITFPGMNGFGATGFYIQAE